MSSSDLKWTSVCDADDVPPMLGVRALLDGNQVAIFNVKETYYAIDAVDPFTETAVLSRGIVGDLSNQIVVASPLYKQHFNLTTGVCLEDDKVCVKTYPVRKLKGKIQLAVAG